MVLKYQNSVLEKIGTQNMPLKWFNILEEFFFQKILGIEIFTF